MDRGQAILEYVAIIFAVLAIAVIVAIAMGWFPGISPQLIFGNSNKDYWQSATPFAITSYRISASGQPEITLKNNTSQSLSLLSVKLGSVEIAANDANFTGGDEKNIADAGLNCERQGEDYSYDISITYLKTVGQSTVKMEQKGEQPLKGTCG